MGIPRANFPASLLEVIIRNVYLPYHRKTMILPNVFTIDYAGIKSGQGETEALVMLALFIAGCKKRGLLRPSK